MYPSGELPFLGSFFPAVGFVPGTAGCQARTLPLCFTVPPLSVHVVSYWHGTVAKYFKTYFLLSWVMMPTNLIQHSMFIVELPHWRTRHLVQVPRYWDSALFRSYVAPSNEKQKY